MIVSQNDYECKADDSDGEGKNRPVATIFQFLKMLHPSGTALLQRSRVFEVFLLGRAVPQTLLLTIWKSHNYAPLGPRELTLIGGIEL